MVTLVVASAHPCATIITIPVVVTLTASVIVAVCVSDTVNTIIGSWSVTSVITTDWVTFCVVNVVSAAGSSVMGFAYTCTVNSAVCVVNTGDTIVVGHAVTASITSSITMVVYWKITCDTSIVGITLTGTKLVDVSSFYTADTVHVSRSSTSTHTLRITLAGSSIWLLVVVFTALTIPVRVANTHCRNVVVLRSVVCTVNTVCGAWAGARPANGVAYTVVYGTYTGAIGHPSARTSVTSCSITITGRAVSIICT
jgi:hypothetical protein